jgi:hypothetical protein
MSRFKGLKSPRRIAIFLKMGPQAAGSYAAGLEVWISSERRGI